MDPAHADVRGHDGVDHAPDGTRARQVDGCQTRVWIFAAHERNVELARKLQVFDIAGLSAQQARVL